MNIIPLLLKELEQEAATTRKMLSRIPEDKFDWRPHPKCMNIGRLSMHIAELPGWITMTFDTDGLDFAKSGYVAKEATSVKGLLDEFESNFASGKTSLEKAQESELSLPWILRNGDTILQNYTKYETIRVSLAQTIHHRAQLGVFLRLLDVPSPGSYGPSADEPF